MATSQRKKKPVLTIKNKGFQSPKNRTFSKGLIHAFGQKMTFFLYLDLIKIRREIMLSDFTVKKETFFDHKKAFFKVQKMAFFSKGLTHAFGQKMPIFSLFKFDQNKPRNSAF